MSTEISHRKLFSPALKITDAEEAQKYLDHLIEYYTAHGHSKVSARQVVVNGLRYYASFCNEAVVRRIYELYRLDEE